jgi:hypothetical protein
MNRTLLAGLLLLALTALLPGGFFPALARGCREGE